MKDLFNFNNKNNIILLENASKLGLKIYHINIGAQKINNSIFKMFEKVQTSFQIENKLEKTCFF